MSGFFGKTGTSAARFGSVVVVAAVLGTTCVARADDGIFSFFQQAFGGDRGGAGEVSQPLPQPDYAEPGSPPLVVRMHRHKRRVEARVRTPKEAVQAAKDVTIYTDKTLERGDIVMTVRGMRVFNGSQSWPYTDRDFVAIASMKTMPADMSKELRSMDLASRMVAAN